MSAPADVIRVQDIEPEHFSVNLGDAAVSLRGEEFFPADAVERLLLRKSHAALDYLIPYGDHLREIAAFIFSDCYFAHFIPPGDFQRKALSP